MGSVRGTLTATEIGKWIFLVNPGFSESLHFPLSPFNLIRVSNYSNLTEVDQSPVTLGGAAVCVL